jgi:3',5'-cyclic AMP phosphodiesterase CpdA
MKKFIIVVSIIVGFFVIVGVSGYAYFTTIEKKAESQIQVNLLRAKKIYDAIPIWHKKIHTQQDLKVGIITDTHVRPIRINKSDKSENAPRQLKDKDVVPIRHFVEDMKVFQPNFVVHLGDVIEGTGDPENIGIMGIRLVEEELEKSEAPVHWVVGNHDLRSLTKEQFRQTLNLDSLTQTFDIGDYRFIILDANYNPANLSRSPGQNSYIRGHLPPDQLKWIKKQLATDKQTFIFMHHGAFLDNSSGDYNEEKKTYSQKNSIDNAKELQDILDEYRVAGLFDGHMEARRHEKTRWTSFNSFTGTKKSKDYPDSYYELTITDGIPDITMYYLPQDKTEIKKVDFESGEK